MRALFLAPLLLLAATPASAQSALPEGVAQLVTCSNVYSMHSDDAKTAGDEGTATEFFHLSDALLGQARAVMESAGYTASDIEDVEMNNALVTGFRYGAGEAETMLAECLAAADAP
jgi:hypothetical protein